MDQTAAPRKGANTALSGARPALTLRLQVALDEQQRLERAARIRQLREDSPYTQEAIAERIGVKLRSYQKWEEGGGIEWDHMEALADLHEVDVRWIHKGEPAKPTPDLMGDLNGSQLDRVEEMFREILERLEAIEAGQIVDDAEPAVDPEAPQSEVPGAEAGR